MASYSIPIQDGTYDTESGDVGQIGQLNTGFGHQMSIKLASGSSISAGSLQIFCKGKGSDAYEEIPDSPIDLTAIVTPMFEFNTSDYRFVVSGSVGSGRILITDLEVS